jgi:hypothetical protein
MDRSRGAKRLADASLRQPCAWSLTAQDGACATPVSLARAIDPYQSHCRQRKAKLHVGRIGSGDPTRNRTATQPKPQRVYEGTTSSLLGTTIFRPFMYAYALDCDHLVSERTVHLGGDRRPRGIGCAGPGHLTRASRDVFNRGTDRGLFPQLREGKAPRSAPISRHVRGGPTWERSASPATPRSRSRNRPRPARATARHVRTAVSVWPTWQPRSPADSPEYPCKRA